jgi:hypothetical protein
MMILQGAVATAPVAAVPVAAGAEALELTVITTLPCMTWPLLRTCSTVAVSRAVTTQPLAVCPPYSKVAA